MSTATLELLNSKNGSKEKRAMFEKWRVFELWQNWSLCKGHGPCKMVSLSQKLELLKSSDNFFKIQQNCHYARAIAFAKSSIWVKYWNCWKHVKNVSKTTLSLFHVEKRTKKNLITTFPPLLATGVWLWLPGFPASIYMGHQVNMCFTSHFFCLTVRAKSIFYWKHSLLIFQN